MRTHYIKYCCSILIILSFHGIAHAATTYKWLDDAGQVNFSQRAPIDRPFEVIKMRLGTKVLPPKTEMTVDQVIEQQVSDEELEQQAQEARLQAIEKDRLKSKNCEIASHNLQQYEDNPRGLIKGPDGEYDRIDEVERQIRIQGLRQDVQTYCQ